MNNPQFAIGREDGRSNQQVILDYVTDGEPGHTYTYEDLIAVLNSGSVRQFTRITIRQVIVACGRRLLKEQQRALNNVRNVGYRLAFAAEHNALALSRKRRSDVQLKRGMHLLQHVRWNELDDNQKRLHEGTLLIIGGLYEAQAAFDRRLKRVEEAIHLRPQD